MSIQKTVSRSVSILVFFSVSLLNCYASPDAESTQVDSLLKQILSNIERRDKPALEQLTISQDEFRKYVWPAIGNRAGKTSPSTFYTNYSRFSEQALDTTLQNLGGTKWELVKTNIREVKNTSNGRLVWVRDVVLRDGRGTEKTVNVVGCLLEQDGALKVATYYGVPSGGDHKE